MIGYCCPSFEGFVDDVLISWYEGDGYRIKIPPKVINTERHLSNYSFTSKSVSLNFCPWCGSRLLKKCQN